MKGDYPSEEDLQLIREATTPREALEIAEDAWNLMYGSASAHPTPSELAIINGSLTDRFFRFVTGGWSGNEDILQSLEENIMARSAWRLSAAGGLHIYQDPKGWEGIHD